jgi:hypothetical protein
MPGRNTRDPVVFDGIDAGGGLSLVGTGDERMFSALIN